MFCVEVLMGVLWVLLWFKYFCDLFWLEFLKVFVVGFGVLMVFECVKLLNFV